MLAFFWTRRTRWAGTASIQSRVRQIAPEGGASPALVNLLFGGKRETVRRVNLLRGRLSLNLDSPSRELERWRPMPARRTQREENPQRLHPLKGGAGTDTANGGPGVEEHFA